MAKKGSDILSILQGIEDAVGNKSKKPKLTLYNGREQVDIVSFGVPGVDAASNAGGHARGKVVEIFGPESCGKTTLALKTIAAYQAAKSLAALIDVEHSFWGPWAAQQGVDVGNLVYGQDFTCGEQALMYGMEICRSGKFGVVVVDSIAALMPRAEVEADFDETMRMGAHAAMMSTCIKQLQDAASKTGTTLICTNQIRNKLGVVFGNPEDTPGGKALKFYASQRLNLRRINVEMGKGADGVARPIGIRTHVKFEKNRVGMPFGEDEFVIYFSPESNTPKIQLVNFAIKLKMLPRKAWNDKKDKDDKHYFWNVGDELVDTECKSASDLVEWFDMEGKVLELLDKVEAKAKEREMLVPEEILAVRTAEAKAPEKAPEGTENKADAGQ